MSDFIYPNAFLEKYYNGYTDSALFPRNDELQIIDTPDAGKAIIALRRYERGEKIGHFTGEVTSEIRQHTLQITPEQHLYDPHFIGYLLHSCDPNCVLDMSQRIAYCVKDIEVGEFITMDYATTEDVLFRQFPCSCMAPNCRGWVTGRAERVQHDHAVVPQVQDNQIVASAG